MKPSTIFAAVGASLIAATSAFADSNSPIPSSSDAFTIYKEMDLWTVYADASTKTCLAESVDDVGNVFQMGLTKDHQYGYIGVFTQADVKIPASQEVAVIVDGNAFVGKSYGIKSKKLRGDYTGGYALTQSPEFVDAIANGQVLIAFPEMEGLFVVDLTGTKDAIEATRACNKELASS
ncbi:hypothetical protein SAMN05444007_106159 [Cribrihabitans marinus]|uniref:Invasion protein IalB, involved in pathogenesis n=1 Tax=Cribrihabitans marinus TaxID=1227549 RepID=A0A1H7ATJ6_9RHOB|nr:hypothetical protein [Cribrihabitans marinus]GGH32450.1 hypothetical protein GCM10010973_23940 [Cribrihabitans marinus]SEJ68618.1 hypothetical protein SAMN05444007_106159 [Cribrihabitans marinus]